MPADVEGADAQMQGALDASLAASIAAQARHVRATLTPERNHRTLELYALLIAGVGFGPRPRRSSRKNSSMKIAIASGASSRRWRNPSSARCW